MRASKRSRPKLDTVGNVLNNVKHLGEVALEEHLSKLPAKTISKYVKANSLGRSGIQLSHKNAPKPEQNVRTILNSVPYL